MTDQNTYPDLANVEDWLNAKGYTGEAGACHAAMSLIRKQEARIAALEAALNRLLLEFDFMVERGVIPDIRNDIIFVEARAASEGK